MDTALTPLQCAYLLGRSELLPLGGVAMHDFREFRGNIEFSVIKTRLTRLVQQYDALRTHIDENSLVQHVSDAITLNLDEIDFTGIPRSVAYQKIDEMRRAYSHKIHDLSRSPWYVWVIKLAEPEDESNDHFATIVFVSFDALILDGRAISLILFKLFEGDENDQKGDIQTRNIAHLLPQPSGLKKQSDAQYWSEKLKEYPGPPTLPWKKPPESIKSSRYRREKVTVPSATLNHLSKIASSYGLFQNTILSTIILEIMSFWTQDSTLCIGVPVAIPGQKMQFSNESSFIAAYFKRDQVPFLERASAFQNDIFASLEHLDFSGVDINKLIFNQHQIGLALPVVLTNGLSWKTLSASGDVSFYDGLTQTPQVAMDIRFSLDQDKNLALSIDYAEKALEKNIVQDILQTITQAITLICRQGNLAVDFSQAIEYHHYKDNGDDSDFICSNFLTCIADNLLTAKLKKSAIICGDRQITYSELGEDVQKIVNNLNHYGLRKGSVVAICLPRSPEHVMVTIACALLGIIWVPIDVNSPSERLDYLLTNCHPDLIVTAEQLNSDKAITLETLLISVSENVSLPLETLSSLSHSIEPAYYLYTSGTTGKPKCVVLNNKATSHVIGQTMNKWEVKQNDVFISVTPLHHDMSVFDLFASLTIGATLVIPEPHEEKDAIRWNRLVSKHKVSIWCSVPAILEMLIACQNGDSLSSLRLIAQGGDYIKPMIIAEIRTTYPDIRLFSLGGPTETTIWSIWHEITSEDVSLIPYGKPLPATQYFICNDINEHCPVFVTGRIYTTGVNLALGYLEDGIVVQKDFVTITSPKGEQLRAFRTGDQGYYRKDGTIIFASRVNGYVKIRGIRVSLPDIESELCKHPQINNIVVVDYPNEQNGDATLGAMYTTLNNREIPASELRDFSHGLLPVSHIPTRFTHIQAFPLSANGKIDRHQIRAFFTQSKSDNLVDKKSVVSESQRVNNSAEDGYYQSILGIYLHTIGAQPLSGLNEDSEFLALGLRPSHLKEIARRLTEKFGVILTPQLLVKCKNARQVFSLLSQSI
ncbi:amino acid adenylation domain-containing protein [Photorhabdus heterorhabditis]|uniref:amino acid adenylation domain-containing protein n=1 Tax=Photorhabdus heterorhabditis TaxID=880156 RepID=UPI001561CB55|nr:amino acid adenylation domain-containing protein [Photorhabdus heterorhabditis]NRN29562.1 amino acid adenylation domain-containing protein [Photorhabdus heterorhabditis subsp. aluminescens]